MYSTKSDWIEMSEVSDNSSSNLLELLIKLNVSEARIEAFKDWQQLHAWQTEIRSTNHLCVSTFVREYCHLEPTSYLRQLVCKSGSTKNPSTKEGTEGKMLRDALRVAFEAMNNEEITETQEDNKIAFEDWYLDNIDIISSRGISRIYFDDDCLVVCWHITIDVLCLDFVVNLIEKYNAEFDKLKLDIESLNIKNMQVTLLSFHHSPLLITSEYSGELPYGTGTV